MVPQVEYLQLALSRANYPTRVDGIFGRETCGNLQAFLGKKVRVLSIVMCGRSLLPYLKGYVEHTIAKSDSLYQIAREYKTTEQAILTAKSLIDPKNLQVDAVLEIPLVFRLYRKMSGIRRSC